MSYFITSSRVNILVEALQEFPNLFIQSETSAGITSTLKAIMPGNTSCCLATLGMQAQSCLANIGGGRESFSDLILMEGEWISLACVAGGLVLASSPQSSKKIIFIPFIQAP